MVPPRVFGLIRHSHIVRTWLSSIIIRRHRVRRIGCAQCPGFRYHTIRLGEERLGDDIKAIVVALLKLVLYVRLYGTVSLKEN